MIDGNLTFCTHFMCVFNYETCSSSVKTKHYEMWQICYGLQTVSLADQTVKHETSETQLQIIIFFTCM